RLAVAALAAGEAAPAGSPGRSEAPLRSSAELHALADGLRAMPALLQRLVRPALPRRRDGTLLGPVTVWLRLLALVGFWCDEHLGRRPRSFRLLAGTGTGAGAS
ncbi:MAG: hypothetical protein ACK4V5_02565, partial [Cyanobium sp.]